VKQNIMILALLLVSPATTASASEPRRKATLSIALDDSAASQMLRAEMSRDWLQANSRVVLTKRQKTDLAVIGRSMNAIQAQLLAEFMVLYVDRDCVPLPERLYLPAIRINRGRWESLDRRAFAFETRPLLTLDWYRTRYAALYDRDASLDALAADPCRDEGYSGPAQIETPAPWETVKDR
jgi:hypothetical protein